MSIADLRKEYLRASLDEADTASDPIVQFERWFDEALKAEIPEPSAMSLATVAANGRPSSRIVLLKGYGPAGFTWFTNYDSRKGHELVENPHAALLFLWVELERQVRIEGRVEKIPADESDAYFDSRPLGARINAIASEQSRVVASRERLEQRFTEVEQRSGDKPARPPHWGGYRLTPVALEFWQGRKSRMHDRIAYGLREGKWVRERLQP
jgi:pyridoxamine 5'-phosphate oxidase